MTIYENIDENAILNAALSCAHCSMCYQTLPSLTMSNKFADICPSGLYFNFEAYYSPGRNEIARAILQDEFKLEDSKKLQEIIYSCTTCGACEANCRYVNDDNVLPVHITEAIRAILNQKGLKPMPNQIKFAEQTKILNNPYGESGERNSWLLNKMKGKNKKAKYFYFVGCTSGYRLKNIAEATFNILQHLKEDFTLSSSEICCGSPLIRTGQLEDIPRLVNENIKIIQNSRAKEVIFSCAGCYRTVTFDWPHIYGKELPFKTIHMTEYLAEKVKKNKLKFKTPLHMTVAYHDPCHLGRHMFPNQIYEEPRYVIDQIPGIERITLDREMDSTLCCGAGGGVKAGLPEYSEYIASLRVQEVREKGADTIITPCPFCIRGLSDGAKKESIESGNNRIAVIGLTELVNKAMGGN